MRNVEDTVSVNVNSDGMRKRLRCQRSPAVISKSSFSIEALVGTSEKVREPESDEETNGGLARDDEEPCKC